MKFPRYVYNCDSFEGCLNGKDALALGKATMCVADLKARTRIFTQQIEPSCVQRFLHISKRDLIMQLWKHVHIRKIGLFALQGRI